MNLSSGSLRQVKEKTCEHYKQMNDGKHLYKETIKGGVSNHY